MKLRTTMFDSFYNQPEDYYPDNMHKRRKPLPPYEALSNNALHEIHKNGKFVGYWWHKGDTVSIPLSVNTNISVEDTAIIYDVVGAEPGLDQVGFLGQRLYNIVDITSWTMIRNLPNMTGMQYLWKKDDVFTFPTYGELGLRLMPNMEGKNIIVQILNFRREEVLRYEFYNTSDCVVDINKEDSDKILQGVYYLKVSIESNNTLKQVDYYELQIR